MSRNLLALSVLLPGLIVGWSAVQGRFRVQPRLAAPVAPALRGKPVPAFELSNLKGAQVRLADFKAKVLLVNFWATWCAPCIVEIPWLVEFQKKYAAQDFEVVGISMDEAGVKDVAPFVEKHGMIYPVLLGNDEVARDFGGIRGLPTTFLVDRNGRYYSMHQGLVLHDEVERELQTLLK